jgi:hypothetical protein
MPKPPMKATGIPNRRALKIGLNMVKNEMMYDTAKPLLLPDIVALSERRIKCQI